MILGPLLILCTLLFTIPDLSLSTPTLSPKIKYQVCGEDLRSVLALVCMEVKRKRGSSENMMEGYDNDGDTLSEEFEDDLLPWSLLYKLSAIESQSHSASGYPYPLESLSAGSYPSTRYSRLRRDVSDECCNKACSLGTLRRYCAKPRSLK